MGRKKFPACHVQGTSLPREPADQARREHRKGGDRDKRDVEILKKIKLTIGLFERI